MGFKLRVEGHFSAAHNLRDYKGKCEDLHGHNWRVEVQIKGDSLDKAGMVMDFKDIKGQLYVILEELDHKYLNEVAFFKKVNPTSENLARYIFGRLAPKVKNLSAVTVWESDNSSATYER